MKHRVSVIAILTLATLAMPSFAQIDFVATIEAGQVVGGSTSTATGMATATLNAAQDALTYSIVLVGVDLDGLQTPADTSDDVTAFHFHDGFPGSNGGVVFGLIAPLHDLDDIMIDPVAGTVTGVWENTDTPSLSGELANLLASGLYLNVHTVMFGGGAIRGQVERIVFSDGFESGDLLAWSSAVP